MEAAQQLVEDISLVDITPRTSYDGSVKDSAVQDDLPIFGDYVQFCATALREGVVYYMHRHEGASVEVYWHLRKKERSVGDRKDATGWKIHVSVANTKENIAKAWQLVAAKIIEYGVYEVKVVGKQYLGEEQHQKGKEIVIYEFSSRPDINWQSLLQELENDFKRNEVVAGKHPKFRLPEGMDDEINEPSIKGSEYFYCETDDMREQLRVRTCSACCRKKIDYEDRGIFKDITISTSGWVTP